VEQVGEGIIVADAEGRLTLVNSAAAHQHEADKIGVPAQQWSQTYGLLTVDNQPLPLEQVPLYSALQGEQVRDARFNVRRPDGQIRELAATASPIRRPDGSIAGGVVITLDKTEQLAVAEERERLLEKTQRAVQIRDELLAVIAHDLRNPAGSIKLTAQIMRRMLSGEVIWSRLQQHVDTVQQLAIYMGRLIADLVNVASIDRGQLAVARQPEDPRGLDRERAGAIPSPGPGAGYPATGVARRGAAFGGGRP
jgi:signal transduction histidine kinase